MKNSDSYLSRLIQAAMVVVLLLPMTVSGSMPVDAQTEPDLQEIPIGHWIGEAVAQGVAQRSAGGMDFHHQGSISADFDIVVSDETTVEGEWFHQGSAFNYFEGSFQGQEGRFEADIVYEGSGSVSGTPGELVLDGTSQSTGQATVTSSQGSFTTPVSHESQVPTMRVKILGVTCNEVYGDWAWAVEQAFEEYEFTAELDGYFMAIQQPSEIEDRLDDLHDSIFGEPLPERQPEAFWLNLRDYLVEVQDFIDEYPDWNINTVMDALSMGEHYINELRNMRPCDRKFFGEENIERFMSYLTWSVQQLIIGGSQGEGVSGEDLFLLMEAGSRTGAFGPGAYNPAQAVRAEETLRQAAEQILEENVDPSDGYIWVTEDTKYAMRTGAIMGWDFVVAGETFDARQSYQTFLEQGGSPPGEEEN